MNDHEYGEEGSMVLSMSESFVLLEVLGCERCNTHHEEMEAREGDEGQGEFSEIG